MAWQPPATDAVDQGWQPPSSDAVPLQSSSGINWPALGASVSAASQLAPWNKLTNIRQNAGGDIAEAGGYLGAKAGFPQTGQAIGVGLGAIPALGPEVLSAYTGLKGIYNSPNPTVRGLVNTPQELSPQYAAQNQAIGISNEVPETASKVQYENPYQYASQLSKPKYVPVKQSDLLVLQPGAKTGDPHALFAYNDNFGEGGTPRSIYNVYGDPQHPALQARGWGSSVTGEDVQAAGIPVTGREPNSIKYEPIPSGDSSFRPVENPNGPAFSRPRLSYPADSGPGAAQPLPSTVPTKYPDDPGTLINMANSRISQHGTNLSPQELSDMKNLLSTKMANGDIPKLGPDGKMTSIFAQASQTQKNITNTLNQVAEPLLKNAKLPPGVLPTRAGLNQAYSVASKQQAATLAGKKAIEYLAGLAGAGYGAGKVFDFFKK